MAYSTSGLVLAATSGGSSALEVIWDLAAAVLVLLSVIRTVRLPSECWAYRRWSKAAAIVVALWGSIAVAGFVLPVGAAAIMWHSRSVARRLWAEPTVPDLPFAEGGAPAEEREG